MKIKVLGSILSLFLIQGTNSTVYSQSTEISIKEGWNLISLPQQPENTTVANVLKSIAGYYTVYSYNSETQQYAGYFSDEPSSSELKTMEPGKGYWIYVEASSIIRLSGHPATNGIRLVRGWNLIGYNSTVDTPIQSATRSIEGKFEAIYSFDNNSYRAYIPSLTSDLELMSPGKGYWIYVTEATTLTFPVNAPPSETPKKGEEYKSLTANGVWCWFADPRAVYYEGSARKTYTGWVNNRGDVEVSEYNHLNNSSSKSTLKSRLQYDDHANPSILMLRDGRLMVFYSAHLGDDMFYRISTRPEDISSWGPERKVPVNTSGDKGYTYPNPVQLTGENNLIYLFWRGGNFKPTFSTTSDTVNWSPARMLIGSNQARPYVKVVSNGVDKIHFAFTDGHPRDALNNNIYYFYYHRGAFYKANGTKIKDMSQLPLLPSEADKVYDGRTGPGRGWVWDIALDSMERPVIAYTSLPSITDHRYRYSRWDGKGWVSNEITNAGKWFPQTRSGAVEEEPHYSGGMSLDHNNPSVIYLSKPVNGVFEIQRWVTSDLGKSWTSSQITRASTRNNVRPFAVRGYKQGELSLLWMYGDYITYTNYNMGLKYR
jgi:hypothetical protein